MQAVKDSAETVLGKKQGTKKRGGYLTIYGI